MENRNRRGDGTTQFLIGSFTFLLLISAMAFLCLGVYMSKASKEAIGKVGDLYMAGINEQISAHFQTLMDLKLEQVETAMDAAFLDTDDLSELYDELIYRARVRNFQYLALCSEEGDLQMIYGEQIQLADPESFFESLRRGEKKVAVGTDESGNEVILFGVAADYPMRDGEKCMAAVAALPIDYISTRLDAGGADSLMYSLIIREDGSFIMSNIEGYEDYFSSLYGRYAGEDPEKIQGYIQGLSDAMMKKEDYSVLLDFDGGRLQIYCTSLSYSEWHLVTVLPFGVLNESVDGLSQSRIIATILVFVVILVVLLYIFFVYFRMTCQQLDDLEKARQEALQATKAKSEFLSNMSHDIRTPMNAIVGMTAIATAHIDDKEQVQNCLKKIALSGKHLLGLINDVLDMSKIESGKMTLTMERVSLREVVEGIVNIVQTQIKGKGQHFNIHIDNIVAEDVYCDSVRLNQVLMNLLSNAVKYTQEGGTIRLSLYQEDAPSSKGDSFIRTHVVVSDNGIGMSEEFLRHIFDSYARADSKRVQKIEGAGLGMAITKYIVDAMEGSITVESELDKGTTFHVILDMERAFVDENDMHLPAGKMLDEDTDLSGRRILVAEDNELNWEILDELLSDAGLELDWAENGQICVEKFRESQEGHYDAVLMDVRMPVMNGYEATGSIRALVHPDAKEIPIIAMTADAFSEDIQRCLDSGMNAHTAKPINLDEVLSLLKKYIL